jgi:choline dehydrogenase
LRVSDQRDPHPLCQAFFDAAATIGLPPNPDYNSGDQEGTGLYQQLMRSGRRWSAADAYLRPAIRRSNVRMMTRALVERICVEGRRATGVVYRSNGRSHRIIARREVLLAGGAINSPQLLQLSGIGDGDHLRGLGIEVVHHLPGVGASLRDHYAVRLAYRVVGTRTLNERARGLPLFGEVIRYVLTRRGLLAMSPAHAGAFARTRPELATPDMQYFFTPASYEGGRSGRAPLERQPGMSCGCSQMRPESRGWVAAVTPDPTAAPEIQPNYLADPIDQTTLVAGMRLARRIFDAPPLARFVAEETFPGVAAQTDEDLLDHARRTGSTIYHPIGSCRMGDDPSAVVDPSLRVAGVQGLRVIDASIMPIVTTGNTNAPTIMIAEKGAAMIREDARG